MSLAVTLAAFRYSLVGIPETANFTEIHDF
jgi:hypothetical protein